MYFIKLLRSPTNTYYLTFYKDFSGKQCFSYEKLSIKDIKDMNTGTFKYQGSLEDMELIIKKFYSYRLKPASRKRDINQYHPTLQRTSKWLKVNKSII